jgi:hypothetical protein
MNLIDLSSDLFGYILISVLMLILYDLIFYSFC